MIREFKNLLKSSEIFWKAKNCREMVRQRDLHYEPPMLDQLTDQRSCRPIIDVPFSTEVTARLSVRYKSSMFNCVFFSSHAAAITIWLLIFKNQNSESEAKNHIPQSFIRIGYTDIDIYCDCDP